MIVTERYYTRDGRPMKEVVKKAHIDDETPISVRDAFNPATDTEILESEYDILVADEAAVYEAYLANIQADQAVAFAAYKALVESAKTNLVNGTPLTQAEADAIGGI